MAISQRLSILSNATPADIRMEPYPHLIKRDALDPEVFAELAAEFPADDVVVNGRPLNDTWYDYPACSVVRDERISPRWREFFAYHASGEFFRDLVTLLGGAIRATYPGLEGRLGAPLDSLKVGMRPGGKGDPLAPGADVSMECQFYVNYTRAPRAVRGPHVDRPSELFAALLYFRQPADDCRGGDLEICRARSNALYPTAESVRIDTLPAEIDDSRVETIDTATYAPNTLVLFLNSPRSVHAVSARTPTPVTRRHINFCCDLNFDLFELKMAPRLQLRRRIEKTPVAWRLARWI